MILPRSRYARTSLVLSILIGLVLLTLHVLDILGQYRAYEYIFWTPESPVIFRSVVTAADQQLEPGDKIVVIAKLEKEDTEWVKVFLPDWQRAIYIVDPSDTTPKDALTTPMNKGHEAMAYLTFLVDNYDTLPSTIAFLHSHRDGFLRAWHTDAPLHDNVYAMQHLQLDFVHHSGYVNLRCKWNPGCLRSHSGIIHVTLKIWQAVFANTSTPPPSLDPQTAEQIVPFPMPSKIGVACCAQFVVSREQVYKRPREDYVIFRDWVADTELNDAHSGRVMEYLWHIIFAADAVQ
ncbi:hypothetical protein D6D11_09313 [Aureobasidium pullulans]|nr:hypothetical protein D6D11_09313 [Aureobasidium pullulans]